MRLSDDEQLRSLRIGPALQAGAERARVFARRIEPLRQVIRSLREGAASKHTSALRRAWLGELTYRRLTNTDLSSLLQFAEGRIFMPEAFLVEGLRRRWWNQGRAVGAFDRHGLMRGFACLDTYAFEGLDFEGHWIRSITVDRLARNMGVAQRLLSDLLCHAAAKKQPFVRAAIAPDNHASLALFSGTGFEPICERDRASMVAQWKETGPTEDWRIVELPLRVPATHSDPAQATVPVRRNVVDVSREWPTADDSGAFQRFGG